MTTVVQENVLQSVNGVSKLLQKGDMDLFLVVDLLATAYNSLTQQRDEFEDTISTAQGLAAFWNINGDFSQKRTCGTGFYTIPLRVNE